jgi:hypothetical protein
MLQEHKINFSSLSRNNFHENLINYSLFFLENIFHYFSVPFNFFSVFWKIIIQNKDFLGTSFNGWFLGFDGIFTVFR